MNVALTIQEKLKDLRVQHGLTLETLAEKTGISSSSLGSYETDEYKDISLYNLVILAKFYEVSTDYLLGMAENKNHPNADLADLHLNDEMIELLQSGKINPRLLCELAVHQDFVKLFSDIEIYVDGIASMQIQNLNAWVDTVRGEIIAKHQPDEQDRHKLLLEAAHIHEDEYFSHRIHEDMDCIIRDLRETHKGESTSAPETAAVTELKKDLAEVASFKGGRAEQLLMLFCKQTKIKYSKLTEEEKQWLLQISKKSELLKSPIKQRGKKK